MIGVMRTSGPGILFTHIRGDGGDLGPYFGSDRVPHNVPNIRLYDVEPSTMYMQNTHS